MTWLSTELGLHRWTRDTWERVGPASWSHVGAVAQNGSGVGIAAVGRRTDERGMLLKRITEHDQSGPTSFWAVKRAIEGIMSRIEWEPVAEHAFSESR